MKKETVSCSKKFNLKIGRMTWQNQDKSKFANVLKSFGGIIVAVAFIVLSIQSAQLISLIKDSDLQLFGTSIFLLYLASLLVRELRWW